MSNFPEPSLRPGWTTEVGGENSPQTDGVLVAVQHTGINAYADIIDLSSEDEISIYAVRAVPDLTQWTDFSLLDTVLEPGVAVDIVEQFMAQVDIAIEDNESIEWVIDTISHEYAPKNEDQATGHPAESLLEGYPIALGSNPETVCFASGRLIHDSLVHTPRVLCYAVGGSTEGWAPIAFFHTSTNIDSVDKAREKFPDDSFDNLREEILLSGLAIAIEIKNDEINDDIYLHDGIMRRLEFRDPALIDKDPKI